MRTYAQIFITELQAAFTYKWNVLAQFFVPVFQMMLALFVWRAVYTSTRQTVSGYSLQNMSTYIIVTALIGVLCSMQHSYRLTRLVRSGNLSFILLRPYRYTLESLATFLGSKVTEGVLFAALLLLLAATGLITPAAPSPLAVLLLLMNFALLFCLVCLIGDLSFWLIQMWPLRPLFAALASLLGGALFPLDVLPAALYHVLQWNPFALLFFVNAKLLLTQLPSPILAADFIASASWAIVFLGLHLLLWKNGLKRYEGMGV
ncbi:MAG: ABC-2 family transporter protein [Sporolactobacillus sp.]